MSRTIIHQGRIFNYGTEQVTLPNGADIELEIIRHPGAVAIVPWHDDDTITLIHQYRHAAGGTIWEVPAGIIEPDEAISVGAARELAEEVQLAGSLTPMGFIHTTPGFTDEVIHLFLAQELKTAPGSPEFDEVIEVHRLPAAQVLEWTVDGTITDGKTICALHRAARIRG